MRALAVPAKLELPNRADYPDARAYAAALRRMLEPARETTIHDWLARLYGYKAAVAPSPSVFESYVEGIVFALGDQPGLIWTDQTLKLVMLECNLWPEAPKLKEVLFPIADALRQRVEDHDRAMSTGKVVGSRDYMHRQIAAPEPPPPLRDQMRMGKRITEAEAAWEDAKAERRTEEQLAQCGDIGTELLAEVRRKYADGRKSK